MKALIQSSRTVHVSTYTRLETTRVHSNDNLSLPSVQHTNRGLCSCLSRLDVCPHPCTHAHSTFNQSRVIPAASITIHPPLQRSPHISTLAQPTRAVRLLLSGSLTNPPHHIKHALYSDAHELPVAHCRCTCGDSSSSLHYPTNKGRTSCMIEHCLGLSVRLLLGLDSQYSQLFHLFGSIPRYANRTPSIKPTQLFHAAERNRGERSAMRLMYPPFSHRL